MENILLTKEQISDRIISLSKEIDDFYKGKEILLIGVLNGSIIFLSDLIRNLKTPSYLDCISVSSYGNKISRGDVVFHSHLKMDVRNSHVILVDDILDTGNTLGQLRTLVEDLSPKSLEFCVFLKKNMEKRDAYINPRFVGFEIPNKFVYGYGLDIMEKFRNLPYVAY